MMRLAFTKPPSTLLLGLSMRRRLLPVQRLHGRSLSAYAQTLVEKIVQNHVVQTDGQGSSSSRVRSGDFVTIRPSHVMTHDNTYAVLSKFQSLGVTNVADPSQPVFALDHNVQDRSERNLSRYAAIEGFARKHGVDFYPAGRGIGHQVMCEEGYVQPLELVVASDSHSNMYGALGALGTPIVRTDAAALWATTTTWWQVPPVVKVWLEGRLPDNVGGKDVILALCGLFNGNEALNHAVEFGGPGVAHLSIEARMTVANMSTEWGALAGVFPVDDVTAHWLAKRAEGLQRRYKGQAEEEVPERVRRSLAIASEVGAGNCRVTADPGARYARELRLDLSRLRPYVVGPNDVSRLSPVDALEAQKVAVHKAYIVSCVNSRASDLAAAAKVLEGRHVAPGVELYVAAASSQVQEESSRDGHWQTLLKAGAIELPPGCGPCVGLGRGLLKEGEVAISATNRNFKGRMGARNSQAYLASPAVVAESAARGYIAAPGPISTRREEMWETEPMAEVLHSQEEEEGEERGGGGEQGEREDVPLLPGFVRLLEGEVLLCGADNIDTDGIYAGRHCYVDMDDVAQARVAMENYDPGFAETVRRGDVLVSGNNFGCGSSREQAATCLRAAGVVLVLCASANATFKRNALNNGLLLIEAPSLVHRLRELASSSSALSDIKVPTLRTGLVLEFDFVTSTARLRSSFAMQEEGGEEDFAFPPVGPVAQEIILAGGLEGWVRGKISGGEGRQQAQEGGKGGGGVVLAAVRGGGREAVAAQRI